MARQGERIDELDTYDCVQALYDFIELIDGRTKRHATRLNKIEKQLKEEKKVC